jgi:hypothetical protein
MEEDDFEAQRDGVAASLAGAAASSGSGSGSSRSGGAAPKLKAVRPDAAATNAFAQYKSVVAKLRGTSTILQDQIEKAYQEGNGNPLNDVVKNTYAFLNGKLSEGCGFNVLFEGSGELAL